MRANTFIDRGIWRKGRTRAGAASNRSLAGKNWPGTEYKTKERQARQDRGE